MKIFGELIAKGMCERGHVVERWTATPFFHRLPAPPRLKKWLGYIDQLIIFPLLATHRVRAAEKTGQPTLFVFIDNALGPWVPIVRNKPHVIHVHDLLAIRGARGEIADHRPKWSGRLYQRLILKGLSYGKCFICVSEGTRRDLMRLVKGSESCSYVVYNGLNYPYGPMNQQECISALADLGLNLRHRGFLLHVGGNQWYKNRLGVLEIYYAYLKMTNEPLPLVMVGNPPTPELSAFVVQAHLESFVTFLVDVPSEQLRALYCAAALLVFPSLAEGFGWPIVEAMACGCPVLTTGVPPMTEVGGEAAYYIPKRPRGNAREWAETAAKQVLRILSADNREKTSRRELGFKNARRFSTDMALQAYEQLYLSTLSRFSGEALAGRSSQSKDSGKPAETHFERAVWDQQMLDKR